MLVGCGPIVDIHQAAEDGNIEAAKQHLNAGTDVNAGGGLFGYTPLQQAASGGHKEVAELLLAEGADVNAKSNGPTPIDLSIYQKHTSITDLLRKHGGRTAEELKAAGI